jgi:FAD/FMN-containing dehydrogenase
MANGAIGDGVILDLGRLDQIAAVDSDRRTVSCGPGAIRDAVSRAASAASLRFPVDPSSGAFCTIGGMVATNAAGAHSLAFGSIRRWVQSVNCVFADGSVGALRRGEPPPESIPAVRRALAALASFKAPQLAQPSVKKNSSGYALAAWKDSGDLLDLIVGSEGTLAIVTDVELRLEPVARSTNSLLAAFGDIEEAALSAAATTSRGAVVCELLEHTFLELAAVSGKLPTLPKQTAAVLLVEVETEDSRSSRVALSDIENEFMRNGALRVTLAMLPAGARELWELRHAASPALAKLDPALCSMQVVEDAAVPPEQLHRYVKGVRAALTQRGFRGVIFGHAGDAHIHVNPLVDVRDRDWKRKLFDLVEDVTSLVAELGGTLSGEHGDGRLRAPLLPRVWPAAALSAFSEIKRAFDPEGILNPGVKLAERGQQSIETVKYDPSIAALPAPARRALDLVTEQRAYSSSRLSLLGGQV